MREWVAELASLPSVDREQRSRDLAGGAPRGVGRKLVIHLLVAAAKTGKAYSMLAASTFAAFPDITPGAHEPQRAVKGGTHDKIAGPALAADRIARRLVAYPFPIEPHPNSARRAEQRLLQEAAAHILHGEIRPPAQARRVAIGQRDASGGLTASNLGISEVDPTPHPVSGGVGSPHGRER